MAEAFGHRISLAEVQIALTLDRLPQLPVVGPVLAEDGAERLGRPGLFLHPDPPVGQRRIGPQEGGNGLGGLEETEVAVAGRGLAADVRQAEVERLLRPERRDHLLGHAGVVEGCGRLPAFALVLDLGDATGLIVAEADGIGPMLPAQRAGKVAHHPNF
ncbi:MAG TPA: hypothetical protein VH575_35975 [Gemmataceae bacterium]